MPVMPSDFYVPAFTALGTAVAALSTVVRILWHRNIILSDRIEELNAEFAVQATKVITINNEALRENTYALHSLSTPREYRQTEGRGFSTRDDKPS